ncbi:DUF4336 domain-containing protein [Sphingorhabdus sp.]|uniref:DUF4336 domain-containing protein n=1 Tax=Sphingorhabdus sp. TaxID=1902408 RepID=UPI0035946F73
MTRVGYEPYEPQLTISPQAEDIWTVEGPEVQYRLAGALIPCPTRMTVVKLANGTLWLHSPVAYSANLQQTLDALGPVSAIIAPNSYHYLQVDAWASTNADATVFASADVAHKIAAKPIALGGKLVADWSADIDHISVELGKFSETVFFHRPSQSLVVTDLMQTFEASRVRSLFVRLLLKLGGATGPNAKPSIEIRLAARKHRDELRVGVEQMIAWNPRRVILSHGACIQNNSVDAIESAFRWLKN